MKQKVGRMVVLNDMKSYLCTVEYYILAVRQNAN